MAGNAPRIKVTVDAREVKALKENLDKLSKSSGRYTKESKKSNVASKAVSGALKKTASSTNMATRSVKKAGTEFKKTTASVKKSTAAIDKTVAATSKSSSGFKKLASDIGKVALGVNQSLGVLRSFRGVLDSTAGGLLRAHDANVVALNSIRPFTESVEEATLVHNMFRESAINTGVGVEALSDTFKNLRVATESAGFGVGKVVGLTQDLAKTLRASGTTVGAASGALRQLGQAFSAGALRGEEFNSIMENMALLATGLEVSLGVGRGELRALAMQGKITSDALSDAIEIAGEKADKNYQGNGCNLFNAGHIDVNGVRSSR